MKFDPLYHLAKLPALFAYQWKSRREILELQNRALRKLIEQAYHQVPYYHRLLDKTGVKPGEIRSVADLAKIPLLTKNDILAHYPQDILSSRINWNHCSRRMTSGSSGKKMEVVLDNKVAALYRLMQLRQWTDLGYRWHDKIAYIRYGPPATRIFLQRLGLFQRSYIPLEWTPERQAEAILQYRPKIINAYPSVLYLLAKAIDPAEAKALRLKFILSNSELLTDHIRAFVQSLFHCQVFDDYSCLEFSAIGFECKRQNLHIATDNVVVEIIDQDGNPAPAGTPGRMVITSLNNFSMPYIRYEIGDVGSLAEESCPCGRELPLLKSIVGRCDDFITLPSGRMIDPQTVVFQIEGLPEVKEFRVVQQEDYRIEIKILAEEGAEFKGLKDLIQKKLKRVLDEDLSIEVEQVPVLDRGATGKHRSVLSYAQRT